MKKQFLCVVLLVFIIASILSAQTGHWEKLNPPVSPSARSGFGMCSIGPHKALLYGGNGKKINGNSNNKDTWLFDYDSKTWVELKPQNNPGYRNYHSMCQLSENIVLLFGGLADNPIELDDTWLFNLNDTSWVKLNIDIRPERRSNYGLSQIGENFAILFGGLTNNFDLLNDTWLFNLKNNNWICIDSVPDWWNYDKRPYLRMSPVIAPIEKNKVILFGGWTDGNRDLNDTWIFTADINDVEEHNSSNENITISPNPATDFIEISVPDNNHTLKGVVDVGAQRAVPEQIRIYDVFGELVNLTQSKDYPTPTLPKGRELRLMFLR